jgi:hypothetical protein
MDGNVTMKAEVNRLESAMLLVLKMEEGTSSMKESRNAGDL